MSSVCNTVFQVVSLPINFIRAIINHGGKGQAGFDYQKKSAQFWTSGGQKTYKNPPKLRPKLKFPQHYVKVSQLISLLTLYYHWNR